MQVYATRMKVREYLGLKFFPLIFKIIDEKIVVAGL
jgi:hypothetical protein